MTIPTRRQPNHAREGNTLRSEFQMTVLHYRLIKKNSQDAITQGLTPDRTNSRLVHDIAHLFLGLIASPPHLH